MVIMEILEYIIKLVVSAYLGYKFGRWLAERT